MCKFSDVCSKPSIKRFIKLWLSLKETPYWFHQTLTLGQQIEDFGVAKPILEKLFDSLEVEMGKTHDMGAVYIMAHQENDRVHFHVVFFFYGTPAETPENLAAILRRKVWKRWKKLNSGLNHTGNRLTIRTKGNGLWYLLTNHLTVGKTGKEKGKPSWYGIRNKRLIEANASPVTMKQVQREFDRYFPVIKPAAAVAKQPKGVFYDRRKLADLKGYLEYRDKQDWESFKRAKTGRKGKIGDADFINFLNAQNGWKTVKMDDGKTL
jgi:hypothetical protein